MNNENNKRRASACEAKEKMSYQRKQYIISGFAAFLTLGSLTAYILVSIFQGEKTREALKLTERSINLADSNSRIENRAWVGIESEPKSILHLSWEFSVDIKNFGKTPAESLCIGKRFCFSPLIRPSVIMGNPISISPGGTDKIDIPLTGINDSTFAKISDGRIKLYYYGIITYKDISGGIDTTEFMFLCGKPSEMEGAVELKRTGINRMK